jgi:hypothetical protein
MTTQRRGAPIGASPTASQKLIYVAKKLGLPGLAGQQGSTFNLFDTVLLTAGTDRQTLNFFSNTSNKSRNFSNFQNGSLKAGEAMVIEEICFFIVNLTNTDLTSNANAITGINLLSGATAAMFANAEGAVLGMLNLSIANQKVVKDYMTFELHPFFNPQTTGVSTFDTATATNTLVGASRIKLESPPVLPPNQSLNIAWEIGVTGAVAASTAIMCVAGRFGSLFSAKTTL